MCDELLQLAGEQVTVFLKKGDTISVQTWGALKYKGNGIWKAARPCDWDSCITFHEADVEKVEKDRIYLK